MLSAAQTGLKYIIPILYTRFSLFASEIAYIFRGDTLFFGITAWIYSEIRAYSGFYA